MELRQQTLETCVNPIVEQVMEGEEPYRCPRCGAKLKCFFHERDSTSDSMDCPKCSWWAHTGIDGEWRCIDDIEKEAVKVQVDNLIAAIKEAGTHYVFDPIPSDKLLAAFEQTLQRFAGPEQNLRGHIVVTPSLHDPRVILFGPKDDAPQWVFDMFEQISKSINENKEDLNS